MTSSLMNSIEASFSYSNLVNIIQQIKGVIPKNFNKGALGAMSESGCGPFPATPTF